MSPPQHYLASSKPTLNLVGEARSLISRVQGIKIKNAIHADKLLLALLEFAIGDEGRRHTASVILAAGNDKNAILEVAQMWLDHLLFPFKAAAIERIDGLSGEQTPDDEESCSATNFRKPVSEEEEALHRVIQQREGNRCAVTSIISADADVVMPTVRATHILPHILHAFDNDQMKDQDQPVLSANSWDIIEKWGSLDVQNLAIGPTNTIGLRTDLSLAFRHFLWWLKATDEENTYVIKSNLGQFPFCNRRLTFKDHSKSNIPVPDPRILQVHAALANVLHVSGTAQYFDRVWSTAEKSGVLSEDGSSDISALLGALAL